MQILYYILFGYLVGIVLVALRLGWFMVFRLDKYDFQCGEVWSGFFFISLIWPLIFKNPQILFDPAKTLGNSFEAEIARLRDNPPPCGSHIIYRQGRGNFEDTYGEFIFNSDVLEEVLIAKLLEYDYLKFDQESAILNWLQLRDNSITTPTELPKAWNRFEYLAYHVLRNGQAEVRCLACNKKIPISNLVKKDGEIKPGTNSNRLMCPNGHSLLSLESVHIFV